jgi:hypothetical protein
MNMPMWFSNLAFWSAQVALLVFVGGFLPRIFQIRQPRVLLVYWRAILAISLVLPFAQPWHRAQNVSVGNIAPEIVGSIPLSAPAVPHRIFPAVNSLRRLPPLRFWLESRCASPFLYSAF